MAIKVQHVFVSSHSRLPLQAVQIKSIIVVAIVCCHCLRLNQHQIHCILVVMPPKRSGANLESILYKTISGRYRAYPDGLKSARYRFEKNASWEKNCMKPIFTMLRASELFIVLGNFENRCVMSEISNPNDELVRKRQVFIPQLV